MAAVHVLQHLTLGGAALYQISLLHSPIIDTIIDHHGFYNCLEVFFLGLIIDMTIALKKNLGHVIDLTIALKKNFWKNNCLDNCLDNFFGKIIALTIALT